MQYLAKVEKATFLGTATLQLVAQQVEPHLWECLTSTRTVQTATAIGFNEGALVLVRLSQGDGTTVEAVDDALPWVLELIDTFLKRGITPEFLVQEAERAEQWRQSLTMDSQEVDRRTLEAAARRDEIQELEKNLKLERERLEEREAEFHARLQALEAQEIDNSAP